MENKKDYIVRGTAANGQIRCFAITSRNLVEEARSRHQTSPVITAALGRLLSGGAMMGAMMKGEKDLLTLQIQCSGPVQGLTVTADAFGHVKGYAVNPVVSLPARKDGESIELHCHFCNSNYSFSIEELKQIKNSLKE